MEYKYKKIDKKIDKIIKKVLTYMNNLNVEYIETEIKKAYEYSKKAHEWDIRLSWEPYIVHPVEAVEILLKLKPDLATIQACLLHDVIEDTPKTEDDISEAFWDEVTFLCVWMEKLSKVKYRWEERNIWSLRKMFIAMADDLRVIFIKLADRLHNMKTLKYQPKKEKRERIALETLNIYAPIADRLWLYHLKNDLDEECFKILDFEKYKKLRDELKSLDSEINIFTSNAKKEIEELFVGKIINYEIDFRVKSIYSIHKKLLKKWLTNAKELYDLFWIRIMVWNESDCYRVLWLIHSKWTPLPKRFKDYIALPKPNGYKSLHTNVMWLIKIHRKQPTEIQIKTYKMKEYSDLWVAAHFEYKESWSKIASEIDWVNELKELVNNVWDSDFVWSLKVDVFKDRIFVFTPKWDFVNLPAGSTSIDFAYSVHTELWDHIILAKVNDSVHPLDKWLHNWDVVEIIIDKNKKPNPFWISFVKTVKAKNRIKSFLKKEDRELHIERWKDIVNKNFEKVWLELLDRDLSLLKSIDWVVNNKEDRLKILERVWNFSISPSAIIKSVLKNSNLLSERRLIEKPTWKVKKVEKNKWEKIVLIIWWEEGLPYKLWHCCRRKVSNDIVWHINSKWIITIHRRKCNILNGVNKERLLSAYLAGSNEESIVVNVDLVFKNEMWVLKDLSDIIFSIWIDIDWISSKHIWKKITNINLKLKVLDYDYIVIDRFIERLKLKFWDILISTKIWNTIKK
jgi:GTP diphosphokinase / guanosine-3',5'-bis(diphosphate) 3'-diphosphatase